MIKYKNTKTELPQSLLHLVILSMLTLVSSAALSQSTQPQRPGIFKCSADLCKGSYQGPEFNHHGDIAHQFSNTVADRVGRYLKELYNAGHYSKVDFARVKMETLGMDNKGEVLYRLEIPLIRVQSPCEAFTSFDHVGGWGHAPELAKRKRELASALLIGDQLQVSTLMKTPEGLEEYWIQWRNRIVQAQCQGDLKEQQ